MRLPKLLALLPLTLTISPAHAAAVVADPDKRWPSRTVDFIICDGSLQGARRSICEPQKPRRGAEARSPILSADQADLVRATVDRWNDEFGRNLRLREVRKPKAASTLVFRASSRPTRCSTKGVGYSATQPLKYISIGDACTPTATGRQTNMGTVAHEILHGIGFYHEQQRADRHRVIRVSSSDRKAHQWRRACADTEKSCRRSTATAAAIGSYDFGSVMHYSLKKGTARPTVVGRRRLRAQDLRRSDVGQRDWLTPADIRAIRALYPSVNRKTATGSSAAAAPPRRTAS